MKIVLFGYGGHAREVMSQMDKKMKDRGAIIEDIQIIPGINYYAIK